MKRLLALSAAAAVVLAASGNTAAQADGPAARVVHIAVADGKVTLVVSAVGLAPGQHIDPASATVSFGDAPVPASAQVVGATDTPVSRTVLLVVDVSGSMKGGPLAAAKKAIHAFIDAMPVDVRVGLVSFGSGADLVAAASTDHARVLSAVDALTSRGETSLYDGVLLALANTGSTGARAVVVLSDGQDTVSTHSEADVLQKLSSDVLVDVVPFGTAAADTTRLAKWAKATGGRSIEAARSSDLAGAFAAAAADASNQVVITATVPVSAAGSSVNVTARVTAGSAVLSASAFADIPASAAAVATASAPLPATVITEVYATRHLFYGGLAAVFVALLTVLAVALGVGRGDRGAARVQKHLAVYSLTRRGLRRQSEPSHFGETAVARTAVELADRVARSRGLDASLRLKLDAAGLPFRPGEWVILHLGVTFGAALVLLAISGGKPIPALVGLLIGALLPGAYLSTKQTARKSKFAGQLAGVLQMVAGSLSAGFSLPQAFDTAAREGAAPMSAELSRALIQARLGMPLEDALEAVGERMGSTDFEWVVMAIRIQRDVGGNLAEVLNTVAETLRERDRLRRQVKTLSAEGRLSAYVLFALPLFMAVYMLVVRPEYISVLWHTSIGLAMLLVGVGLQALGAFWLKKVATVEV
ncbi:MAG: tight adherence protein [Frankiaceae bacterium]|jgi:tight adherence protein B|nr:tight adherence protein [Frankiaceae bacterium]